MESRSEHPIAKAIVKYCSEQDIGLMNVEGFEHFPGLGVIGRISGLTVAVGSTELMYRLGIDVSGNVEKLLSSSPS
ncbi:hypothetical protein [Desulfurococcus sp.]|uniref:hypothetical protein n=1 Tax=Desulfurococcus sp. TaxID=51678 RepID=UPI00319E755B